MGDGVDLSVLSGAKARGWDWGIHTSFCSDSVQIIARVRAPGATGHHGTPKLCESLEEAVSWIEAKIILADVGGMG